MNEDLVYEANQDAMYESLIQDWIDWNMHADQSIVDILNPVIDLRYSEWTEVFNAVRFLSILTKLNYNNKMFDFYFSRQNA